MKIVLSVQPIRFPMTGIGRYTLELARHLAAIPDVEDLRYFSDDHFVEELPVPGQVQTQRASLVTRIKHRLARSPILLDIYRKRVHDRRAQALAGLDDYLYHGPNFYLPPFPGRSVVTIHDLSIFTMPEHHPAERVMFLRKEVEFALKQATMLITDSHYTRREVADYFGWPLKRSEQQRLPAASSSIPAPQRIPPSFWHSMICSRTPMRCTPAPWSRAKT